MMKPDEDKLPDIDIEASSGARHLARPGALQERQKSEESSTSHLSYASSYLPYSIRSNGGGGGDDDASTIAAWTTATSDLVIPSVRQLGQNQQSRYAASNNNNRSHFNVDVEAPSGRTLAQDDYSVFDLTVGDGDFLGVDLGKARSNHPNHHHLRQGVNNKDGEDNKSKARTESEASSHQEPSSSNNAEGRRKKLLDCLLWFVFILILTIVGVLGYLLGTR